MNDKKLTRSASPLPDFFLASSSASSSSSLMSSMSPNKSSFLARRTLGGGASTRLILVGTYEDSLEADSNIRDHR